MATVAIVWCAGMFGLAQVSGVGEKHPAFEVVSIRRHSAESGPVQRPTTTANGFRSIGLNLFAIFQTAYVPPNQSGVLHADLIEGAPGWMCEETYDVVAKVDEADFADWQKPEMRQTMLHAMLQTMLAERFNAVVHHESKEVPVYDLVVAKGGPKFKQAETVDADELRQKPGGGGMMSGTNVRAVPSPSGIRYYGISMAILTQTILPNMAGRPVVDKSGLGGYFDLTLPDIRPLAAPPGESQAPNALAPPPGADESIFTVLPEALGLRLEPAKGKVDMLVIDHVERPSEN